MNNITSILKRVIEMLPSYEDKVWEEEPNNARCDISAARQILTDAFGKKDMRKSRKCKPGMMPWECSECELKVKDHEIGIHVNNLRDIAIKYAGTQQLRGHIRNEVYRFNKWTDK